MHETKFIHRPLCPGPVTKGLGVVAGITAICFPAAWVFAQHRTRYLARVLAWMPCAANILPTPRLHSATLLKQFVQAFHRNQTAVVRNFPTYSRRR